MFVPFVLDSVAALPVDDFSVDDLKASLATRHHLQVPLPALKTILVRVVRRGGLRREGGRYFRDPQALHPPDLATSSGREWSRTTLLLGCLRESNGISLGTVETPALLLAFGSTTDLSWQLASRRCQD